MADASSVVINLPSGLADRIRREMGQRFATLDDSVVFLLERALKESDAVPAQGAEFSSEEKKAIEDRLKSLGYF